MLELLAAEGVRFDDFRLCMHHPDGVVPELTLDCDCRKPAPGMLLEAAGPLGVDLEAVVDDRRHRQRRRGGPGGGLQDSAGRAPAKRAQAAAEPPPPMRRLPTWRGAVRLLLAAERVN